MYTGAIKPSYNYNQYKAQRATDMKILKRSLYGLMDNTEELARQVNRKVKQDNERYKANCAELDLIFKEQI